MLESERRHQHAVADRKRQSQLLAAFRLHHVRLQVGHVWFDVLLLTVMAARWHVGATAAAGAGVVGHVGVRRWHVVDRCDGWRWLVVERVDHAVAAWLLVLVVVTTRTCKQ